MVIFPLDLLLYVFFYVFNEPTVPTVPDISALIDFFSYSPLVYTLAFVTYPTFYWAYYEYRRRLHFARAALQSLMARSRM